MRLLGWLLVSGLIFVAVIGLLMSVEPFYHHREEREAFRAYLRWQEAPSAEAEEAWKTARDVALRKEMKLRGAALLVGASAAVTAGVCARRLRRSARANPSGGKG